MNQNRNKTAYYSHHPFGWPAQIGHDEPDAREQFAVGRDATASHIARERTGPRASRHRQSFDHHRPVAEGFESGVEISAPVCCVAALVKARTFRGKRSAF